jgi:hypothetical protein
MEYYSPIHLENLEIIQQKVYNIFPKYKLNSSENLFYLPNNLEVFFGIEELKTALDKINFSRYVRSFGFFVINKTNPIGTTIHTDVGKYFYSFNIPILNCKNTLVNFYKTDKQPVKKSYISHNKIFEYYQFNHKDCILQDKLELISPHVVKVKEVHNVVNNNFLPRITLLVRLNTEINLGHLFSKQ